MSLSTIFSVGLAESQSHSPWQRPSLVLFTTFFPSGLSLFRDSAPLPGFTAPSRLLSTVFLLNSFQITHCERAHCERAIFLTLPYIPQSIGPICQPPSPPPKKKNYRKSFTLEERPRVPNLSFRLIVIIRKWCVYVCFTIQCISAGSSSHPHITLEYECINNRFTW